MALYIYIYIYVCIYRKFFFWSIRMYHGKMLENCFVWCMISILLVDVHPRTIRNCSQINEMSEDIWYISPFSTSLLHSSTWLRINARPNSFRENISSLYDFTFIDSYHKGQWNGCTFSSHVICIKSCNNTKWKRYMRKHAIYKQTV